MGHSASEEMDHSVKVTGAMIDELDRRLGWDDKPRSYRLLMAVLHATWEWSSANETAGSRFPVRRCGTHYERCHTTQPEKHGTADFLARVNLWFKPDPFDSAPAIVTVFELLSENVSAASVDEMCRALPPELTGLSMSESCPAILTRHRREEGVV